MQTNLSQPDYKETTGSIDVIGNFPNISTIAYVPQSYTNAPYILSIIFYTISTCGILFNLFTIAIICLHRPMHKQLINIFIVNQSIIDTLASTLLIFTTKFQYNYLDVFQPGNLMHETLCKLWYSQAPMWSLLLSSTYGIIAFNFERYLAVVHPVWHKLHFSKRKVILLIAGTWLIGPCYYIPYATMTSCIRSYGICSIYNCYMTQIQSYTSGTCCFLAAYVIPLGLLLYFYITMILAMHRKNTPSVIKENKDEGLRSATENMVNIESQFKETNNLKEINETRVENKLAVIDLCSDECTSSQEATQPPKLAKSGPSGSNIGLNIAIDATIESNSKSIHPRLYDATLQGDKETKEKSISSITSHMTQEQTQTIYSRKMVSVNTTKNDRMSTKKKTASKNSGFASRARGNIIKTLVLVSIGFVLCWSGSEIYFFLSQIRLIQTNYTGAFYNFTVVMVFLSCCINPIIYCIQYRQFKNGVKEILSRAVAYQLRFGENKIIPTIRT